MHAVRWLPVARNALDVIWDRTPIPRRPVLTEAIDEITRQLRDFPYEIGESRDGNSRVAFIGRMTVAYTIDSIEQVVYVDRISETRRQQ